MKKKTFIQHCTHSHIIKTSIKAALLVGVVLALINHYEAIFSLSLTSTQVFQIIVTFLVPFSVATYSAAKHAQNLEALEEKVHH